MSVLEAIKSRRSIRDFQKRGIPAVAIESLIDALRWAPSAGNLQSRRFYFVLDPDVKKELARAALNQDFIAGAPLTVVACLDRRIAVRYGERGVNLYSIQDVSASIMSLMLAAQELGLGTVWVGAFNEFDVFEILKMPDYLRPIALVPVGYPSRTPHPTPRLAREELVTVIP
jgi:nitroreductase